MNIKLLKAQLSQSRKINTQLQKEVASTQLKAQKFTRALLKKYEEDRKEISRELHDEVAQLLTGINFELSALTKEASKSDEKLQRRIAETQKLISESVEVIHQFARQLRPKVLDDLGLVSAIKSAIKEFTRMTNIEVHLNASTGLSKLNNSNKTILYRIAQEALFNITKHAQASKVSINIKKNIKSVRLEVIDNGISFDVDAYKARKKNIGIGIQGMEERVSMVNGTLKIVSKPGSGTKIIATVPFTKEDII